MNSTRAEKLFQYDHWANSLIIKSVHQHRDQVRPEALQVLSHMMGARQIWFNRIKGIPVSEDLMQTAEIQELERSNDTLTLLWMDLIHKHDPASTIVEYQNFAGQKFSSLFSDIITHVVNHGTYHRGQIARIIRESGVQPPSTDYIVFARQ